MSVDWAKLAKDYFDAQPHPQMPSLTVGDYATAVKLATRTRFGGHATAHEADLFWREFKTLGISPKEYEEALDRLAPHSFVFHGRPPSMSEIKKLATESPAAVRQYYGDLPDRHYPDIRASDMVAALQAAEPHARRYLGRGPVKLEARTLVHSKQSPADYFRELGATMEPRNGDQAGAGGGTGTSSPEIARRQPTDERSGNSGVDGVHQG